MNTIERSMVARLVAGAAILLISGALGPAKAVAAEQPIQGEERARLLERLEQGQREVASIRATVLQRKRHPMLKAEAVSEGVLIFQRPNRLRWEVTAPERSVIVVDGATLLVYHPARGEAERRDLRGDFGAQAALDLLASGMNLSVPDLEKRFKLDLNREEGQVRLILTPRSRWVAQAVASITLFLRDGDRVPRQIVVLGQRGDRTETTLTDVVINPQLPDDPFRPKLGPDVRVTDLRLPAGDRGNDR